MGTHAYYSRIKQAGFADFKTRFESQDEAGIREFEEACISYDNAKMLNLDRAYSKLGELLSRAGKHAGGQDDLGKKTIYGEGLWETAYYANYITASTLKQILVFLHTSNLSDRAVFVEWFGQLTKADQEESETIDKYYKDPSIDWHDNLIKIRERKRAQPKASVRGIKALLQSAPAAEDSMYSAFKADLEYHYEYFLELQHFYEQAVQEGDDWIYISIG